MKRLSFILFVLALVLVFASTNLSAQQQSSQIAIVNAQAAINAHPAGQRAFELTQSTQTDLDGLRQEVATLTAGATSINDLTPEQRERYDTLSRTIEAVGESAAQEINGVVQPAIEAVDTTIQAIAQENGFSLVLDGNVAGNAGIGLIVYAQEGLDITEQVIARVQSGQ